MAAVYLHLQALADRGTAPAETADIYDMFTAAMLRPLPPRRQKFLAVMGLADEFTGEMARFITKEPDTAEILSDLTAKNAFVTRLPGGGYRFHHMMKACAQRDFDALPPEEQARIRPGTVTGTRKTDNICRPWRPIVRQAGGTTPWRWCSGMRAFCWRPCGPSRCWSCWTAAATRC